VGLIKDIQTALERGIAAFEQILYNFKGYGFPADEIARIKERRWRFFITWVGWAIAVVIAVIGWILK